MTTHNTLSTSAVKLVASIAPVGRLVADDALPKMAANDLDPVCADHPDLAEEVSFWAVVTAAFAFQLLLVNLLTFL